MMKLKTLCIFTLMFFLSCEKEEYSIINLNNNAITALGHAGMGIGNAYPMNSFESISKCLSLGMDGSEFDLQMTKDSVLVLYHDRNLSLNTNQEGLIHTKTWEELKSAVYNQWPYLNYHIISLDQLFSHIENLHQFTFTIDCKLYTEGDLNAYTISFANSLIRAIERYHLMKNVCIESQNEEFLSLLKKEKPDYQLFIYPPTFEEGLEIALKLSLFGITIANSDIAKTQVETAHNNNLRVAVWNLHSEADHKDAIRKNPDFIQTDKVVNLIKLIR